MVEEGDHHHATYSMEGEEEGWHEAEWVIDESHQHAGEGHGDMNVTHEEHFNLEEDGFEAFQAGYGEDIEDNAYGAPNMSAHPPMASRSRQAQSPPSNTVPKSGSGKKDLATSTAPARRALRDHQTFRQGM